MTMQAAKAVKFSVSFPDYLLEAVDKHYGDNRSGYLQQIAERDLMATGKLPGSPQAEAVDMLLAAMQLAQPAELVRVIEDFMRRRMLNHKPEEAVGP